MFGSHNYMCVGVCCRRRMRFRGAWRLVRKALTVVFGNFSCSTIEAANKEDSAKLSGMLLLTRRSPDCDLLGGASVALITGCVV